jgi:glucose-6-phosphate 1-dehydrogenase
MTDPTPIRQMVIFGASGDLTSRYLLPALAELWQHGQLPVDLRILGVAQEGWDSATFRQQTASGSLRARDVALPDDFLRLIEYAPAIGVLDG